MAVSSRAVSLYPPLAASLAGLLFGFDTAVIAGVTGSIEAQFQLSPSQLGAAVSAALWGTLVGALIAGKPGDAYGSRALLLSIAVLYVISAVGSALSWDLYAFVAFRFIGGLAIGGSSVLAPVYISEISPAKRRGFLVGLFQLNIVIGILLAYFSNFLIAQGIPADVAWRVKLGVAAVPSVVFLLALLRVPASPRWLLSKGRHEDAQIAALALRIEMPELADPQSSTTSNSKLSWSRHRAPILLAVTIAGFNQFSGINAILYYLNDIFAAAGFNDLSSDLQAVAIGAANLVATIAGISLMDRVGRKPLLLVGSFGTAASLAAVALIYSTARGEVLLLPALIAFIIFFATSQGAVIWVYLSEIFPTEVRARGQSLGSATHWLLNALISFAFPVVAAETLALPFWFFSSAMLLQAFIVWRYFPETKGKSLEAVQIS